LKRYSRLLFLGLLPALLVIAGCEHYPLNQPIRQQGYTFEQCTQPADADETFVVLTFSGGGTRAAALAYGVLEKMRQIRLPGRDRTLLDEVDVISTVSGGSFTGAYYALFGDRIFTDFRKAFLDRNIQGELAGAVANPVNWFRLASPWFSRIDLAAELYDRSIFASGTFGDLASKSRRPFLVVNATNLQDGARFEFTGDQFRYLGSDILSYPVARAVAASSAFPFLLAPLSLVNYPYPAEKKLTDEDRLALEDYWTNRRRYQAANNNALYADAANHPYVHLMDGGLSDNLGLRAVYDLYLRKGIRARINDGKIKRFLVIVVNAKTEPPEKLDRNESPPSLAKVAYKTCTISMDNYAFETVEGFRNLIDERVRTQETNNDCQTLLDCHASDGYRIPPLAGGDMKLGVVDLSFDGLPDPSQRAYFNGLPTSFSLTGEQVEKLIAIGGRLLEENPDFKEFMQGAF
jgi:NTE family protein